MKVTLEVRECVTKVSEACTGTFQRVPKRGRPPRSCPACAEVIAAAKPVAVSNGEPVVRTLDRKCPCGTEFKIKPGRGRKATKCEDCRTAGTVYRANNEGTIEAIRAETLVEEAREKAEQAGKDRANNLFNMMAPLLAKRTRELITR